MWTMPSRASGTEVPKAASTMALRAVTGASAAMAVVQESRRKNNRQAQRFPDDSMTHLLCPGLKKNSRTKTS
jgi:hypothetical protein